MRILGWDIGGANLKASDGASTSIELDFPLWKHPDRLSNAIYALATQQFEPVDLWVITMTGELADCFRTKREGVHRILNAATEAAGGIPLLVWTTTGEFVPVEEAIEWPLLSAASNWLALATWSGRMAPEGNALLVDTGSTTTDVIPIRGGFPDPAGRTDVERLQSRELVYTGWKRTPVAAISPDVEFRGRRCPLAAEFFATARDLHLLTGAVDPTDDVDTANGGPASIEGASDRLARMLSCDRDEMSNDEAGQIARELSDRQIGLVSSAIDAVVGQMNGPCPTAIVSGSGEFLARAAVARSELLPAVEIHSLREILGRDHAAAACAFAVARLAAERVQ